MHLFLHHVKDNFPFAAVAQKIQVEISIWVPCIDISKQVFDKHQVSGNNINTQSYYKVDLQLVNTWLLPLNLFSRHVKFEPLAQQHTLSQSCLYKGESLEIEGQMGKTSSNDPFPSIKRQIG
eukprot:6455799-Amphidinium_carterae.3